jgi:hypothetical protein
MKDECRLLSAVAVNRGTIALNYWWPVSCSLGNSRQKSCKKIKLFSVSIF